MNEWVSEWRDDWMSEGMNEWMKEWMNEWMNERVNEWMNEWVKRWMNEWVNEWMNEWLNEWVTEWINEYGLVVQWCWQRKLKYSQKVVLVPLIPTWGPQERTYLLATTDIPKEPSKPRFCSANAMKLLYLCLEDKTDVRLLRFHASASPVLLLGGYGKFWATT
jgi:hypothetical protein